ncbi:hypothetical protein DVH24_008579 [Malus domestica]|uniref:Uncharacterized protein n=1 Tax=Malus domestica TaxID=3750 RepID=A0A498JJG7_MALDO|nr:hypothetical protein DVH24_008579 [Malus domestica]
MLMSSSLSSSTSSWTAAMEDASFSRMAEIFPINSAAADSILAFDTWYAICLQNRQVSKQQRKKKRMQWINFCILQTICLVFKTKPQAKRNQDLNKFNKGPNFKSPKTTSRVFFARTQN